MESVRNIILFGWLAIVLVGCGSAPVKQQQEAPDPEIQQIVESELDIEHTQQEAEAAMLPLTPELIYYLTAAEIAGQRGQIGAAIDLYHQAAKVSKSTTLAGRSAEIALYSRDKQRVKRALKRWLEVEPNNGEVYIIQAPILMLEKDFDAVVATINNALQLSPEKTAEYLARVVDNLVELVSADQALAIIEQLERYQSNAPQALLAYARLVALAKRYDQALSVIDQVLGLHSDHEQALILKADILQALAKGEQAEAILKKIAKRNNASYSVRFAYARALGQNKKYSQARNVFEKLSDEQPENEELIFALGLLSLEEQNGVLAKDYFNKLIQLGDKGNQAAYFMGLAEELNEDIDSALAWFASVAVDSQRYDAAQTRYINLLADNGELAKARLHLQLLRKENPQRVIQYYLFEAQFLAGHNEYQAAFDLYTKALQQHGYNGDLLLGRAMVAERLNRLAVLEEDLNTILVNEPNNHRALNALGYTLTDRTNRHQEALDLINKALILNPNDPFYLDSLGWVYYRLGELEKAEKYLRQAVTLQADPEFLAHLGEVLWQQNKRREAKKIWQQGLEKDATNRLLKETMRRFEQ